MADDDRYVRNALRRTNRYDGDVVVKHVDISKLSTYGALVNDLHVNQSPTVVVIDRELKGRVLTGYVDRISINQTIADARDATTDAGHRGPLPAPAQRGSAATHAALRRAGRCRRSAARRPSSAALDRRARDQPPVAPRDRAASTPRPSGAR